MFYYNFNEIYILSRDDENVSANLGEFYFIKKEPIAFAEPGDYRILFEVGNYTQEEFYLTVKEDNENPILVSNKMFYNDNFYFGLTFDEEIKVSTITSNSIQINSDSDGEIEWDFEYNEQSSFLKVYILKNNLNMGIILNLI